MSDIVADLWKIGVCIILAVGAVGIVIALLESKLRQHLH